jgi:hypothetical protein
MSREFNAGDRVRLPSWAQKPFGTDGTVIEYTVLLGQPCVRVEPDNGANIGYVHGRPYATFGQQELSLIPTTKEDSKIMLTDNDRENNAAKLDLAAELGLSARFNYTNESGETHDVRLAVQEVWANYADVTYAGGLSYDEDGDLEGYKVYRLDRVNDRVVIR